MRIVLTRNPPSISQWVIFRNPCQSWIPRCQECAMYLCNHHNQGSKGQFKFEHDMHELVKLSSVTCTCVAWCDVVTMVNNIGSWSAQCYKMKFWMGSYTYIDVGEQEWFRDATATFHTPLLLERLVTPAATLCMAHFVCMCPFSPFGECDTHTLGALAYLFTKDIENKSEIK